MNLTGRPVYAKGNARKARAKPPTKLELRHWEKVRALGCQAKIGISVCSKPAEIHHCGTGAGGRKDHMKVIGLCTHHHRGKQGIHTLSRRVWEPIYGYEDAILIRIERVLIMQEIL